MEQTKRSHKKKAPQSTGFGESKVFADTTSEASVQQAAAWSKLTVNGKPIPEHLWGLVPYAQTDQGREENNAGKIPARVQILKDPVDKSVEHYRDDLRNELPLSENHDPLRVIVDKHTPKGMRGLMMSEKKVDKEGMMRGVLEYEPVLDANGQRIKHGGMFLGAVPEGRARQAERFYEDKARDRMVQTTDKVREGVDQIATERVGKRLDRDSRGEFDGVFQEDGGEVAEQLQHEFAN